MQYLTFEQYKSMGGTADEPLFQRLEMINRLYVDKQTFNRMESFDPMPDVLTFLMFELVELARKQNIASATRQTSSESNNGISTSYVVKTDDEIEIEKSKIISTYLSNVHTEDGERILYGGIKNGTTFCRQNHNFI